MKKLKFLSTLSLFIVTVLFIAFSGEILADDEVILTGTINDFFQIVTDEGDVFELEESSEADRLVKYTGSRVEVKGILCDEDGTYFILVTSFEVLSRNS